ncbi:MAG: hypothetical protein IVW52_18620 [Acidimicrobiales bacterium]|nr:hypothetical protein [Acidimicrobiales bacterium]
MNTTNPNDEPGRHRSRKGLAVVVLLSGLAGGGILGAGLSANAATPSTSTAGTSSASTGTLSGASTGTSSSTAPTPGATMGTSPGLPLSGTVTAVGASTVTIDTTSYPVTSTTDIDKSGEAALSSLAVGDSVTFSTMTSGGATSIDKLHAGSETLDRPAAGSAPPANGGSGTSGFPGTGAAA